MSKSSHCQERCSSSEVNSLERTAPPTRAELLTTSKGLQALNWNPCSITSSLPEECLKQPSYKYANRSFCLSNNACLAKKKRMDIERALQSALGVYQGALSTKPAGITQKLKVSVNSSFTAETQHTADPTRNTHSGILQQWNSSTATFGFWLRTVQ